MATLITMKIQLWTRDNCFMISPWQSLLNTLAAIHIFLCSLSLSRFFSFYYKVVCIMCHHKLSWQVLCSELTDMISEQRNSHIAHGRNYFCRDSVLPRACQGKTQIGQSKWWGRFISALLVFLLASFPPSRCRRVQALYWLLTLWTPALPLLWSF